MTQKVESPETVGRWWALAALAFSMLTVGLDMTVLNVALPTLASELDASTSEMQWFGASFTLVLGALIIPMGGLGDRLGRKRLLLGGLVLFGIASAACAFAESAGDLIVARAVQGIGGAAMIPLSLAMLPVLFADRDERMRAMNIWVTCSAVGLPLGPIVGGWLLAHFAWGWVFLINAPMVAVGVLALAIFLPETRSEKSQPVDLPGIVLSSAALVSATFGLIRAGDEGWSDVTALCTIATGVVVLVGFVLWERRSIHPVVDLSLFRSREFMVGTTLSTVANFALFGLLFVMPQYFQDIGGSDPLETGIRLLPMIGGMMVATRVGPRLVKSVGPRLLVIGGLCVSALAFGQAATTDIGTSFAFTASWITLLGVGIGLVMPASMSIAMGALSVDRAGAGAGLLQALRQIGGTVGVAILGTVLSTAYHSKLDDGTVPAAAEGAVRPGIGVAVNFAYGIGDNALVTTVKGAFVHGMASVFLASVAITVLGVMLAVFGLPRRVSRAPGPIPTASTPNSNAEDGEVRVDR
ncbi:DHA2 family efflux MFS transporter permease subunit [Aeromicrobium terrae]|uniref:DHA2 family efflux MFS transporter permease subunit n=1 Tax=Aeromicrobium terrae TaxID=2498846 RepID=A0A5C8NHV9_9ACTN|nr:DHA2 family efflux MFS transporter permease subunit [Aeromicrobium terrae]TXL60720.1 DHA2 family efflux MFS transporter permease subunit [Aeromicrobium terrae]